MPYLAAPAVGGAYVVDFAPLGEASEAPTVRAKLRGSLLRQLAPELPGLNARQAAAGGPKGGGRCAGARRATHREVALGRQPQISACFGVRRVHEPTAAASAACSAVAAGDTCPVDPT